MKTFSTDKKSSVYSIISAAIFLMPLYQAHAEEAVQVNLEIIATGLTAPVSGTAAPGDDGHLYVVDQIGEIYKIDLNTGAKNLFLDVKNLLVQLGLPALGGYDERGLLGLAFHPDYATNHLFYTFTTEPPSSPADFPSLVPPDHNNVIREWNASSVMPTLSRVVLSIANPQFNHTGGTIAFGPDKMLYIALGDGGGEDDQDCQIGVDGTVTQGHGQNGTGQDPRSILASILRINPNLGTTEGTLSGNSRYRIPADNPFNIMFGSGSAPVLPEVWAKGLRNPFRFSFDSATLIAGDVGQNDVEELDVITKGGNYGWRVKEGTFQFNPAGCEIFGFVTDGRATQDTPQSPPYAVDPIAQYHHSQGRAVIAGYIYRGPAIPALRGTYVFGDYSKDDKPNGSLFKLGAPTSQALSKIEQLGDGKINLFVLGFGKDLAGELYLLGNDTGIPSGKTGIVKKIVPILKN